MAEKASLISSEPPHSHIPNEKYTVSVKSVLTDPACPITLGTDGGMVPRSILRSVGRRSAFHRRMAACCRESVSEPPQLHPPGAGRTRSLCLEVVANGEASRHPAALALSAPERSMEAGNRVRRELS